MLAQLSAEFLLLCINMKLTKTHPNLLCVILKQGAGKQATERCFVVTTINLKGRGLWTPRSILQFSLEQ